MGILQTGSREGLSVAVVDSGLCEYHERMKDIRILKRAAITEEGISDDTSDSLGAWDSLYLRSEQRVER